jgi:NAD(P)H dehydrogenase (quinone)
MAAVKSYKEEARSMKVLVVFYSMYGHVYRLAEAIAEGVWEKTETQTS